MAGQWSLGRSLAVGAVLGFAVVAAVGIAFYVSGGIGGLGADATPPGSLLVILETTEEDGAHVAGVILHMSSADGTCTVDVIDPLTEVTLPGTSYSALKDAYPFGGGSAVASAWGEAEGEEASSWVSLPESVWGEIVDSGGGVALDVPAAVNVYADGEFVAIAAGKGRMLRSQAVRGLLADASFNADGGTADDVNVRIGVALGDVLRSEWGAVANAVRDNRAKSDVGPEALTRVCGTQQ